MAKDHRTKLCGTCKFFKPDGELCRRYPPDPVMLIEGTLSALTSSTTYQFRPTTANTSACGEFDHSDTKG